MRLLSDFVCVLLTAMALGKVGAYAIELRWQLRAARGFRRAWEATTEHTTGAYESLERHWGRPYPLRRLAGLLPDAWRRPRLRQVVAILMLAPVLLAVTSMLGFLASAGSHHWAALTVALSIALLTTTILLSAVMSRLVMGPLDVLNPDLSLPAPFNRFPAADPVMFRLVSYFFVLLTVSLLGDAGASGALSHALQGSFHGMHGSSSDPMPFLYFSTVTIATVGFGDLYPQNDLARLLTMLNIATGPLLFTWLLSAFSATRVRLKTNDEEIATSRCHSRDRLCGWEGCGTA